MLAPHDEFLNSNEPHGLNALFEQLFPIRCEISDGTVVTLNYKQLQFTRSPDLALWATFELWFMKDGAFFDAKQQDVLVCIIEESVDSAYELLSHVVGTGESTSGFAKHISSLVRSMAACADQAIKNASADTTPGDLLSAYSNS